MGRVEVVGQGLRRPEPRTDCNLLHIVSLLQTFNKLNGSRQMIQFATILSGSDKFAGHMAFRRMVMAATKDRPLK